MQRVIQTFCFLILALSGPVQAADLNDLVVMLGYRATGASENDEWGAGIIVHQAGERAFVVTAWHNLPEGDEKVYVEFSSARGQDFPARVLAEDANLDLAVLEVPGVPISPQLFAAAQQVLVPEGAEVVFRHGVFTVGNPRQKPWTHSETPLPIREKVVEDGSIELRFQSSVVDEGMSGGALFSKHGALLGMVLKISEGEGGALSIETIARKLEEWKTPFSLDENPGVIQSASRRVLADLGLASEVGLRNALKETTPDFGLLHLFWLAGLEEEVKTALGGLVEGSQTAFTSQVFDRLGKTEDCRLPGGNSPQDRTGIPPSGRRPLSQEELDLVLAGLKRFSSGEASGKTCSAQLRLWIRGLVQGGLDPDLVVANSYYRREALLAVAIRSKNVPAMLALLSSGASPHPYQDLSGTEHMNTRLLAPLLYVVQDFVGVEQDELRKAFLSAGLVVSDSIRNFDFNDYRASEALAGLPATPTLAKTKTDPICLRASARYAFDWCRYLRELGPAIRFNTGTQECDSSGYCPAQVTHTLFVGEDRALLLAERRHVFSDKSQKPVVVEVSRESGQWYAWDKGRNYGCIPRNDGFEPSDCWRRYNAFPASFQVTEREAEPERAQAAATPSVLDHLEVEGISLSTPLPKALAILEAAGYTTETVAGPGSHRNVLTTRDYTRWNGDKAREFKI